MASSTTTAREGGGQLGPARFHYALRHKITTKACSGIRRASTKPGALQDTYDWVYSAMYWWPNAAREIFANPSDRAAIDLYQSAIAGVATSYGRLIMVGSWEMLAALQVPMATAMDALEELIAQRRTEGTPMTVAEAALHPHGAEFLRCRDLVMFARDTLTTQARSESNVPRADRRPAYVVVRPVRP